MKHLIHRIFIVSLLLSFVCLASCSKGEIGQFQKLNFKEEAPSSILENFVLHYTENGILKVILRSPLHIDYSNLKFEYSEFPKGLDLTHFEGGEKNTITADYGILFRATNIFELKGNVVVITSKGNRLETPHLYYDRKNNWIYTEEKFKYINNSEGTIMDGNGMDFDKGFNEVVAHKTYGVVYIDE